MKAQCVYLERKEPLTLILSPGTGARKQTGAVLDRHSKLNIRGKDFLPECSASFFRTTRPSAVRTTSFFKRGNRFTSILHLSLSQRERIKVRDLSRAAALAPTESTLGLRPDSPGHPGYKISLRECPRARESDRAIDRALGLKSRCVRCHRVRPRASFPRNRNPGCSYRWDVAGEICSQRSADFADVAKESVRREWDSFADSELASWGGQTGNEADFGEIEPHFQQRFLPPHLNPLPAGVTCWRRSASFGKS